MEIASAMDELFFYCLKLIEESCLFLPESVKTHVGRWTNKLALSGNKEERNEFAKLLLGMIITGNLEAPFDAVPSEGPLQFAALNKKSLGSLVFTYCRNGEQSGNSKEKAHPGHEKESTHANQNYTSKVVSSGVEQSRKTHVLNPVFGEQNQRVELLEQQLQEERIQHELQLHRHFYNSRLKMNSLKHQIDDYAAELTMQELTFYSRISPCNSNVSIPSEYSASIEDDCGASGKLHAVRLEQSLEAQQIHTMSAAKASVLPSSSPQNGQNNSRSSVQLKDTDRVDLAQQLKGNAHPVSQHHPQIFPHSSALPQDNNKSSIPNNLIGVPAVSYGTVGLDAGSHWAYLANKMKGTGPKSVHHVASRGSL